MDFPERLRGLMKREDGVKLAKVLGVSKAAVSRYARGERSPSLDYVVKIADYYGVTTDYLLGHTQIVKVRKK